MAIGLEGRIVAVAAISLMLWLVPATVADGSSGGRPPPHVDQPLFDAGALARGDQIVERAISAL